MSKKFYCAKCGRKLKVIQKANPSEGIVMNLVIPHVCPRVIASRPEALMIDDLEEDTPTKDEEVSVDTVPKDAEDRKGKNKNIDDLFNSFPFVSKLNKATAEHEVVTQESGDKRDKEHLRDELVTSSAPLSILDMAVRSNVKPAHDIEEESNE